MEIKKKIIFFLMGLSLISFVYALVPPSLPDHFMGNLIVDNKNAEIGTEIKIYVNDELEDAIITTVVGKYDLYVKTGNFGDEIKFEVGEIQAGVYERNGGKTIESDLEVWSDRDGDGVSDKDDTLIGESNNVNNNLDNLRVVIDDNERLDGSFSGIKNIEFKDGTKKILSFEFDFDNKSLNLFDLEVKRQSNDEGSILIKGMPNNVIKTVYVDNLKSNSNSVCIKDEEISSISEISSECNQDNEIKLDCPGTNGDYICSIEDSRFKIEGLQHSGVKEFYTAPSGSTNQNTNPVSGSGGGGGGGSGGGGNNNVVQEPTLNLKGTSKEDNDVGERDIEYQNDNISDITGAVVGTKNKNIFYGVGALIFVGIFLSIFLFKKSRSGTYY